MTKMLLITLLAVLASAAADPYILSSSFYPAAAYAPTYSAYTAPAYSAALTAAPAYSAPTYPAAYTAPAYTAAYTAPAYSTAFTAPAYPAAYSAAYTAPAISAAATIPAAPAIPAAVPAVAGPLPLQTMSYSYGSSAYTVQELPVASAASAPLLAYEYLPTYLRR